MFRRPPSSAEGAAPASPRHLLRRAGLLGAALLLLWGAMQLMPSPDRAADVAAADVGTVAVRSEGSGLRAGPMAAAALLAGGVVLALVLRRRRGEAPGGQAIEAVGQMALAPNQQLRLVRCGGEVLLLGVTSGSITLLRSFPDTAFPSGETVSAPPPAAAFGDWLRAQQAVPAPSAPIHADARC